MTTQPGERKLTTILSADAFGYSRMMGEDEAGTLATLKSHCAVMMAHIADHGGRVFNTAGDGLLAEFPSVVKAVESAIRIQRDLSERNAGLPEDRRLRFRIGLNLGDVMVEDGDLYGEGVNIAARLQALAEPDGILISGTVFEHVRGKLQLSFDFLGERAVKNIGSAVPVYRVVLDAKAAPGRPPPARAGVPHGGNWKRELAFGAAQAALLIAFFFTLNMLTSRSLWFQWPSLVIAFGFGLRAIYLLRR